jgi:Predicted exonuclease
MHWNGEDFVLRQYFARHYGEEGPLLHALNEAMAGFAHLVTFNGKTFDVPFLRARAVVHGVRLGLPPRHLDLLHAARRRWHGELADCRLQTIERRVCRRRRVGDVPGEEIPGLYHDFVKHGEPYRLVPVFHHNLLDVITMSDILRALCRPARRRTPGAPRPARVAAAVDTPLFALLYFQPLSRSEWAIQRGSSVSFPSQVNVQSPYRVVPLAESIALAGACLPGPLRIGPAPESWRPCSAS